MSKAKRAAIVWTEAHQVEAWSRIFEIAAVNIRMAACPIPTLKVDPRDLVWTEALYRQALHDGECFDANRIDREVRRVDRLARGEDVRKTERGYAVRLGRATAATFATRSGARAHIEHPGRAAFAKRYTVTRVRVTRIRKVAPR